MPSQTLKRIFQGILILSLLATFVSNGSANSFDMALKVYNAGDYKKAAQLFSSLAEQGDPEAQCQLGSMYAEGKGFSQSYKDAYAWWIVAAMNGVPDGLKTIESSSEQLSPGEMKKIREQAKTIWSRTALVVQGS